MTRRRDPRVLTIGEAKRLSPEKALYPSTGPTVVPCGSILCLKQSWLPKSNALLKSI